MRGLHSSAVPVPTVLGTSEEGPPLGYPYFLMNYIEGVVISSPDTASTLLTPKGQETLAFDLMRILSVIHTVNAAVIGLHPSRRTGTYLQRQLDIWSGRQREQESSTSRLLLEVELRIRTRLSAMQPSVSLLHGDYHLGNVIASAEGSIKTVLDWEMVSSGEPLVDLAVALAYWQHPDDDPELAALPSRAFGFASRHEMALSYAMWSGRSIQNLDVYIAFAHWKLAHIAADIYSRYVSGKMGPLEVELDVIARQPLARGKAALDALYGRW